MPVNILQHIATSIPSRDRVALMLTCKHCHSVFRPEIKQLSDLLRRVVRVWHVRTLKWNEVMESIPDGNKRLDGHAIWMLTSVLRRQLPANHPRKNVNTDETFAKMRMRLWSAIRKSKLTAIDLSSIGIGPVVEWSDSVDRFDRDHGMSSEQVCEEILKIFRGYFLAHVECALFLPLSKINVEVEHAFRIGN